MKRKDLNRYSLIDVMRARVSAYLGQVFIEDETGVYIVQSGSTPRHLHRLIDEPGVSGKMHAEVDTIAPIVFAAETAQSADNLDRVWLTIHATHDRAHVDATVSEIIMSFFHDDADSVRDMSNAMRALQYSFHEDVVRRRCGLPRILDDRDSRELSIMVAELSKRSGSYRPRVSAIRWQANT